MGKFQLYRESLLRVLRRRRVWIPLVLMAVVLTTAGGVLGYYSGRLLPGTLIAGVRVGGLTESQATAKLRSATQGYRVSFQAGSETFTPSLSDVGLTLEPAAAVRRAYQTGHRGAIWDQLYDWRRAGARYEFTHRFDEKRLDAYVASVIQTTTKPAVDATLTVSGSQIQITPEVAGQTTGIEGAESKLRRSLSTLTSVRLQIGVKQVVPAIKAAALEAPKQAAEALIAPAVSLSYAGQTYAPDLTARATWLTFTPDPEHGTVRVILEQGRVESYLKAAVNPRIAYAATPRKVSVNVDSGGEQTVTQEGRDGLAVDTAALAAQIASALRAGHQLAAAVPTRPVAYTTQTQNIYDRWIDVSLSSQTLTAYLKDQPVRSFLISSGTYYHPTVQGTFHIYAKTRSQTMSGGSRIAGDYYSLDNVEWISWWYGDYSIHGTYWHHNFGHPMSHGCVNATNDDAQFIYEWAPIGTPVVVHP